MKFTKSFFLNYIRFFAIGVAGFLIIGLGVILFLDKYYLRDNGEYSVVKISGGTSKAVTNQKITVESGVDNLLVSHDGEYLAYTKNSALTIMDFSDGKKYQVPGADGMSIMSYKWIYDRDRLIISEKSSGGSYAKLYYYDMKEKKLTEIRDNYYDKDVKITLSGKGDKIDDLDLSAQTNLTFLKVTSSSGSSKIWKSNIMVETKALSNLATHTIGKILCLKAEDTLLYEDSQKNRVYKYGSSKNLSIDGNSDLNLLGVDQNDNVYFAVVKEKTATAVYYGSLSEKDWKKVTANKPVDQLYVSYTGDIYANDSSNSQMIDLKTQKKTSYKGKIIGIFDDGFISMDNHVAAQNSF